MYCSPWPSRMRWRGGRECPGLQRLLIPCLVFLLLGLSRPVSAGPGASEYALKAALIYKLTRFVRWPDGRDRRPDDTFGVCLLGRDDFGPALDALEGRTVNGLPITIHRFSQSREINRNCQMLFISDSKKAFVGPITGTLADQAVLTIGDCSGFAERGGMIQFVRHGRRVGFRINLHRAQEAGLKVAAPLLQLATIVKDSPDGGGR